MKRKSLEKSLILLAIGVLSCVIVSVCLIYNVIVSVKYSKNKKMNQYYHVAEETEKMNAWIVRHTTMIVDLAATVQNLNLHEEELKSYLKDCVFPLSDSIMDCYVAWESDAPKMVCADFVPDADYVPQDRDWYQQAKASKAVIYTEPYVDAFTGEIITTIAAPMYEGDTLLGVVGMDIYVTELVELTNGLKADKKGYAILIDSSNNIVVHTKNEAYTHHMEGDQEVVTSITDTASIYKKVLNSLTSGDIVSGRDYDNIRRFYSIVELGNTGWKVLYAADYWEAMIEVVMLTGIILALAVVGMVVGSIVIKKKVSKRLVPLTYIGNVVTQMAEGKLEHEYPECIDEEIGRISDTLRQTCNSLSSYIREIDEQLAIMSSGDFTSTSEVSFVGEFVRIGTSMEKIQQALREAFARINATTGQILNGSQGVAQEATNLASAVSDETEFVGEIRASITGISEQIEASTNNALAAKGKTTESVKIVKESTVKMEELLSKMDEIVSSTEKIVEINSTIADITGQTNLLALNASIEAARAGDAGKGFAVVADEVRNLATKSKDASEITDQLISQMLVVVTQGKTLANEAASHLTNVVEQTKVIEDSVDEIAEASVQQKEHLGEIVTNLNSISEVVQTSAAAAQESAAASEELDSEVEMLKESLAKFIV